MRTNDEFIDELTIVFAITRLLRVKVVILVDEYEKRVYLFLGLVVRNTRRPLRFVTRGKLILSVKID